MGCLTANVKGTVASFINPTVTDIESARVYFSPTQLGEGTPSPENVREIVGRTSVELYQCGKNLIDINTATKGRRINIQGEEVLAADYCFSDYISVSPNTQYYLFNAGELAANARTGFYDSNKQLVATTPKIDPITTTDGCAYIRCSFRKENLQIVQLHKHDDIKTIPFSWKRLPDEYQEVEYIESTGTQYIKTNISTNDLISVDLLAQFTESSDASQVLFSASTNGPNWFGQRDNVYACGASSIQKSTVDSTQKSKIHIVFNSNSIVCAIGDNTFSRSDSSQHQNGQLYKLFNTDYPSKAKIFNCIIYNNDITIANLVPCYRKSDNEIGMYDTVSQTFYTNQGTGTFTKGNDVFSDEVYGGYVDLVTGEVWADHAMFTVDEPNATCTLASSGILRFVFPLKYYFSAPSRKGASMCTMLPENASANWNYGYLDNISATATTGNHQLCLNYVGDGDGWSELVGEEATVENVKAYLRNIGFAICATLRTPILMRTLTPQQLQTFKNENNIWSDADSVEIDYDLAETFDIQKAKRKIIMSQPHVESASNSPSSPQVIKFKTDMKAPLKQCIVNFAPIQEGSGDPSPDNVRNIIGWTEISVKNGENTYSVDWTDDAGTIYGGYIDLVSGELVATNICEAFTSTTNKAKKYDAEDSIYFDVTPSYPFISVYSSGVISSGIAVGTAPRNGMANQLKVIYIDNWRGTQYINTLCTSYSQNSFSIRMSKDLFNLSEEYTEIEKNTAINDYLSVNPIVVYYELATPITYQLTPEQLITLKGQNNLWADTNGTINIKYWTRKPFRKINDYLTIVEWTDKKFISATGKITAGDNSASYTTDAIFLKAGTYNLNGFNSYTGKDITYRIHEYTQTDEWVKQVAYFSISKNSEVDVSFTLDHDSYIRLSMARLYFTGTLTKVF